MKKLNYVKFILDVCMAILFTLLFKKMLFGMKFHEIAGLVIGGVVLVHCALNFKWIKAITKKLFNKNMALRTRMMYLLDLLLLIDVAVIILSGIFISKVVFPNLRLESIPSLKGIHISASYILLMIIGIHLGLHWNWVMSIFKKIFKIPQNNIITYISRALAILVLLFGIYSLNSVGYFSRISFNSFTKIEGGKGIEFNQDENKQMEGQEIENKELASSDIKSKEGRSKEEGNRNKSEFKGEKPEAKDETSGNFRGGKEEGSSNILSVISLNLGIISVFTIITYYLEKLLKKLSLFNKKSK